MILPSMCDSYSKLSIPAAFDMFQNMATLHADHFDIGPAGMNRRNYFWVITRIVMHFDRMPSMMDMTEILTWIQPADRAKSERDFALYAGDEKLFEGRSIWAVMSHETGSLVPMAGLFPDHIDFDEPAPELPFSKISKDFEGCDEIGTYTIRSVDIDLGGHMNNVNYVRAMLGCFTCAQLAEMDISELDMQFILQCYEGETIRFMKRPSEDGIMEVGALNGDGKVCFMAAIK
jgi:acyl-ACP thioesterase